MKKIDNTDFFSQVHEFLLEGKSIRINIRGNSMKPFLREGSHQAEIAPAEGRNLKTGDVVLFRHCSRYVLHRIVAINDERYTMQGDGVLENTETVFREDIIGVMVRFYHKGGHMTDCSSLWWRFLSRWWILMLPARRYLLGLLEKLHLRKH